MKTLVVLVALVALSGATVLDLRTKKLLIQPTKKSVEEDANWWKSAVIYQVYPRSFYDSDNDGIGDIKGITERLTHFKDLGVDAIWLSPIFKSPMKDFGYDISDFCDIQDEYGTMADFDALVKKATEMGLKIILDFVPNHTSDQHPWFLKSIKEEYPYKDYYVWHKGITDKDGTLRPPTNWISMFQGSMWTWNEERKAYYLHQFLDEQPDLNFKNELVKKEMENVIKFWFERGVAGFRIDAVPHLYEDDQLRDEEIKIMGTIKRGDGSRTQNQDETFELIYDWRELLDSYPTQKVIMTESYAEPRVLRNYYTNGIRKGAHFTFNFNFYYIFVNKDAHDLVNAIQEWFNYMPQGHVANWLVGNHDQPRIATRLGTKRVDAFAKIVLLLPGVGMIYQGEELGMTDGEVPPELQVDPQGIRGGTSRDPQRTPYHWNAAKNAGFSKGDKTWLPIASNWETVNLEAQTKAEESHYKVFKKVIEIKKNHAFRHGALDIRALSDYILAFSRFAEGSEIYIVLINYGDKSETADLTNFPFIEEDTKLSIEVKSVGATLKEDNLKANKIVLAPHESYVFKTDKVLKSGVPRLFGTSLLVLLLATLGVLL